MKHEILYIPSGNGFDTLAVVLDIVASFATCIATETSPQAPLDSLAGIFGASQANLRQFTTAKERQPLRQIKNAGTIWIKTAQGYRAYAKTPPAITPKAMIFALDVRRSGTDVIELQFFDQFIQLPAALTQHLGGTLAQTWAQHRSAPRHTLPVDNAFVQTPDILSADNPFGLTRAETRVCHALRDGLHASEIATHLGIGITTVRSHLGKIYGKTDLPTQLAVMHRLTSTQRGGGAS